MSNTARPFFGPIRTLIFAAALWLPLSFVVWFYFKQLFAFPVYLGAEAVMKTWPAGGAAAGAKGGKAKGGKGGKAAKKEDDDLDALFGDDNDEDAAAAKAAAQAAKDKAKKPKKTIAIVINIFLETFIRHQNDVKRSLKLS